MTQPPHGPSTGASRPEGPDDVNAAIASLAETSLTRELLEAAPDGIALIDPDGAILLVNEQMERLTGHRRDQLLGQSIDELVPEEIRGRHRMWENRYRAEPSPRMMGSGGELTMRQADGVLLPVEISLAPITTAGERMTVVSVRDVSAHREGERARRRLLALLDLVPDSVLIIDTESGQVDYANAGAEALLGFRRDELLAMRSYEFAPESSPAKRLQFLEEHRNAGRGHLHELVVVRRHKDGTDIPCDCRVDLVEDGDGTRKFIVIDRDARPRLKQERSKFRRGELTASIARITAEVLADVPESIVYQDLVDLAAHLLDSENASLVLPDPGHPGRWRTAAAVGPAATLHLNGSETLPSETIARMAAHEEAFAAEAAPASMPLRLRSLTGPGVVAPFPQPAGTTGILTTFRAAGREPFGPADVALLAELASQASVMIALGTARHDQQRLAILEDRHRISRDLHDMVIQDVISIGMQINLCPAFDSPDPFRDGLLDRLDDVIRSLRHVVFDARDQALTSTTSVAVCSMVAEATRVLGYTPTLTIEGHLDELPAPVVSHLLSAVREGLSNVARHADATEVAVTIAVTESQVTLTIDDNGSGPGDHTPRNGLANLNERAAEFGGTGTLTARSGGGSTLTWTATLTERHVDPVDPASGLGRPPATTGATSVPSMSYSIDASDILTSFDAGWAEFARNNGAPELAEGSPNRTLWSYIDGEAPRRLWRQLVDRVRNEQTEAHVPMRCDAPGINRWFDLTIRPGDEGSIRFEASLTLQQMRPPMPPVHADITSTTLSGPICSLCGQVHDGTRWLAASQPRHHHSPTVLPIEYRVCPECTHNLATAIPAP